MKVKPDSRKERTEFSRKRQGKEKEIRKSLIYFFHIFLLLEKIYVMLIKLNYVSFIFLFSKTHFQKRNDIYSYKSSYVFFY